MFSRALKTRLRDKRFPENKDGIFFENFDEKKNLSLLSLKTSIRKITNVKFTPQKCENAKKRKSVFALGTS